MIPQTIKVAGMEYYTSESFDLISQYGLLGQINYHKGIIELEHNLSQSRKEQVYIHEVTHGIFREAGYEEQDEEMIDRVSMVLYQVLKDNKLYFGEDKTT